MAAGPSIRLAMIKQWSYIRVGVLRRNPTNMDVKRQRTKWPQQGSAGSPLRSDRGNQHDRNVREASSINLHVTRRTMRLSSVQRPLSQVESLRIEAAI